MWGAGSSGSSALSYYKIPSDYINFIIDSDPNKWEMEFISNSIPIISPEKAKLNCPDLIIIASMYHRTIKKTIKKMGFNSSTLSIFPDVDYKNNS